MGILSNKVLDNWKKFSSSSRGTRDLGWKCRIIYRAATSTVLAVGPLDVAAIRVAAAACFPFHTSTGRRKQGQTPPRAQEHNQHKRYMESYY